MQPVPKDKSDPSVKPRDFHQGRRERSDFRRLPAELGPIVEGFAMSELRFALLRVGTYGGNVLNWLFLCAKQQGGRTLPGGKPVSKSDAIMALRLIFNYAGAGRLALVPHPTWKLLRPPTPSKKPKYGFFHTGDKARVEVIDGKTVELALGMQHLKGSKKVRVCQGHMFAAGTLGMDLPMVVVITRGSRGDIRVEVVDVADPSRIKQCTLIKGSPLVLSLVERDGFLQPPFTATAAAVAEVVPLVIQELITTGRNAVPVEDEEEEDGEDDVNELGESKIKLWIGCLVLWLQLVGGVCAHDEHACTQCCWQDSTTKLGLRT